jgi:plastocyanin
MASPRFAHALLFAVTLVAGPVAAGDLHVVQMTTVNFEPRFVPAEISIRPGDTVRWVNVDPFGLDHAVTSGTGSADPMAGALWISGTLHANEYFERTFGETGDYEFFSPPHEFDGMSGVVRVSTSLDVPGTVSSTWGLVKARFDEFLPKPK